MVGTTNRVNMVPMVMPAAITMPMSRRLAAPAPRGDEQRHHAQHHGGGGHEDGPQAHRGGMLDGFTLVHALVLLHLVGEIHHQDAVLADEADERDQTYLGVDIDAWRSPWRWG